MNAGDLYWVEFPTGAGRAQAGRRPAIIVQGSAASSHLPTVLLVPLTTQLDALRFPGTVLVEPDKKNGLLRVSVALVFQLSVLDKRLMRSRLGRMTDGMMESIWSAFDEITDRR